MTPRALLAAAVCMALSAPAGADTAALATGRLTLIPAWKALEAAGYEVRDVGRVYRPLHGLVFNITKPPPPGWPDALRGTWKEGTDACKSMGTGERFTLEDKAAWLCSRSLAPALWQHYIDDLGPDVVFEITTKREKGGGYKVEAMAYAPGGSTLRSLSTSTSSPSFAVEDLVRGLLAGRGEEQPRPLLRELPKAPSADSPETHAGEVLDLSPVEQPADCATVPRAVSFTPAKAPLATTLRRLWDKSAARTRDEEIRCGFAVYRLSLDHSEMFKGINQRGHLQKMGKEMGMEDVKWQSFVLQLDCDGGVGKHHLRNPSIGASFAQEGLAEKAVATIMEKTCHAEAAPR